jgi:acyl-CoA synthetase (AMP-forming)/AMP-acid ligase II
VGAVFTVSALANRLPAGTVHVLLDDAPATATVVTADGSTSSVDLGSHFGLSLEGDADSPGRDEECAIVYTSAMEGTALGAVLTHRNLMANARQTIEAAQNTVDDHVLALLPFAHLFGLTVSAMAPLFVGARVTTMPRFNPLVAVELIESQGVTEIVGVPAVFAGLLAAIERRGGALRAPALRLCICGGAPLSVALQERWAAATGVELRQGYGLTEASPVALFNRVDRANVRGTLGVPFPGVRVTVREPETNRECAVGALGEICIAGDTVFRGYVRHGDAGLRVIDGWLHSGDLGRQRDGGTIEFHGLRKVMFTRNGFNVYPREGTGALGLEAISRGARSCDFVETRPSSLYALKSNIGLLRLSRATRVFKRDALPFAAALAEGSYDIAFADPPYGSRMLDRVLDTWRTRRFSRVLAVEHAATHALPPGAFRGRYEDTLVTIYRL